MNAICARFLGSARRESLDHLFIVGEAHLRRTPRAYVTYFNEQRPHQGIAQRIPASGQSAHCEQVRKGRVETLPILGGLHHAYRRVA